MNDENIPLDIESDLIDRIERDHNARDRVHTLAMRGHSHPTNRAGFVAQLARNRLKGRAFDVHHEPRRHLQIEGRKIGRLTALNHNLEKRRRILDHFEMMDPVEVALRGGRAPPHRRAHRPKAQCEQLDFNAPAPLLPHPHEVRSSTLVPTAIQSSEGNRYTGLCLNVREHL